MRAWRRWSVQDNYVLMEKKKKSCRKFQVGRMLWKREKVEEGTAWPLSVVRFRRIEFGIKVHHACWKDNKSTW